MWVALVDRDGNYLRDVWTLAGSEMHNDHKGIVYRRTGKFTDGGKPIFKQV